MTGLRRGRGGGLRAILSRVVMIASRSPIPRWYRLGTFAWRHGLLTWYAAFGTAVAVGIGLGSFIWHAWRSHVMLEPLSARSLDLEARLAASAAERQALEPPDFVMTLRAPPAVADVMQTMQRAADSEGVRVVSLQAEEHAPTPIALGHLDLMVSIKGPYPSLVIVLQQVLDRYPGATLRQITVTPDSATNSNPGGPLLVNNATIAASGPSVGAEAHALLAFWSRPLGLTASPAAIPSAERASSRAPTPASTIAASVIAASPSAQRGSP